MVGLTDSPTTFMFAQLQLAKVTLRGESVISEPYSLDTKWDFESFRAAKSGIAGSW